MLRTAPVDKMKGGDTRNHTKCDEESAHFQRVQRMQAAGIFMANSAGNSGENGTLNPQHRDYSEPTNIIRMGLRCLVTSVLHPLEYAKVLIQLGYEPIPPYMGSTIFRRPALIYPNVFQYSSHIKMVDGWRGCYRGLGPVLLGTAFSTIVSTSVADYLGFNEPEGAKKEEIIEDEELYLNFKASLKRDIILSATSIIVAQPFHVISLRMMAQFIGRESVYLTLSGSIREILREEGFSGLFSGLVPKMLCEIACVVLTSSTVYLLNKYVIKDKVGRQYNAVVTQFAVSSIFYPLQVVATCMAITGCGLSAGSPPIMPHYHNWLDCWNDLQQRGQLKRGSSLLWRTIAAPGVPTSAIKALTP